MLKAINFWLWLIDVGLIHQLFTRVAFWNEKYINKYCYSSVAQLVEQLTVNQLVAGSSPARGAKIRLLL